MDNSECELVHRKDPDGTVWLFAAARLVRAEFTNGSVAHFRGDEARLFCVEFPQTGCVQFFEGAAGAERLIRQENPDGTVQHYADAFACAVLPATRGPVLL
eukprot:CAMPEP_0119368808 /NCGR_PEP_ID=MMETSP1334-20130426/15423_1 /TAXON_ID=127549 /ORGANISM="Calcidiscus leptoporus, Strain RCC1130" /LENGTH=100 /DNA_ID=CAMNT_0007385527 /DNA_START=18 /DNA_END=320 /DNA_ORIENTATION=-